jgi:hypothetical protein
MAAQKGSPSYCRGTVQIGHSQVRKLALGLAALALATLLSTLLTALLAALTSRVLLLLLTGLLLATLLATTLLTTLLAALLTALALLAALIPVLIAHGKFLLSAGQPRLRETDLQRFCSATRGELQHARNYVALNV